MPLLTTASINIVPEALPRVIRQERNKKGSQTEKEETKSSLYRWHDPKWRKS